MERYKYEVMRKYVPRTTELVFCYKFRFYISTNSDQIKTYEIGQWVCLSIAIFSISLRVFVLR